MLTLTSHDHACCAAEGDGKPRVVIPMHYNTWDVIGGDTAEVVRLAPGESHTLS